MLSLPSLCRFVYFLRVHISVSCCRRQLSCSDFAFEWVASGRHLPSVRQRSSWQIWCFATACTCQRALQQLLVGFVVLSELHAALLAEIKIAAVGYTGKCTGDLLGIQSGTAGANVHESAQVAPAAAVSLQQQPLMTGGQSECHERAVFEAQRGGSSFRLLPDIVCHSRGGFGSTSQRSYNTLHSSIYKRHQSRQQLLAADRTILISISERAGVMQQS